MAVRVRMFAALRDAAGVSEVTAEPAALPALLDELRARFDEPFTRRLAACTVLVDGTATPAEADVAVPDGAEVALLPPVSGGCPSPASGWTLHGASRLPLWVTRRQRGSGS